MPLSSEHHRGPARRPAFRRRFSMRHSPAGTNPRSAAAAGRRPGQRRAHCRGAGGDSVRKLAIRCGSSRASAPNANRRHHRRHPAAAIAGRSVSAGCRGGHLRRIPRAIAGQRPGAGDGAANSAVGAARTEDRRHVGDAGGRADRPLSGRLPDGREPRAEDFRSKCATLPHLDRRPLVDLVGEGRRVGDRSNHRRLPRLLPGVGEIRQCEQALAPLAADRELWRCCNFTATCRPSSRMQCCSRASAAK